MDTKEEILSELARLYPDAKPALLYKTPYELLVAVILSAQCTDERVNKVTDVLFREHNTPQTMLSLSQEELEKYIFSCGFYHNKAAHILSASRDILERFGGEVPSSREELETLAGVGRKTANVVYAVAFGGNAIAVDTHVFRVSNRLGLAPGKTPFEVEKGLMQAIPALRGGKGPHAGHSRRTLVERASLAHLARKKGLSFAKTRLRCLHARAVLPLFCQDQGRPDGRKRALMLRAPIKRINLFLPHKLAAGGFLWKMKSFRRSLRCFRRKSSRQSAASASDRHAALLSIAEGYDET